MNKLNKNFSRFNLRRRKFNVRRRRKQRLINRVPPILSTKPQKFGPGSPIRYVTRSYVCNADTVHNFPIGEDLSDTNEFLEFATNYNFCRIVCIKLIIRPYNFTNTTSVLFFKMNWANTVETRDSIVNSDVSKMVGPVNPKATVFTFIPPSISFGGYAIPSFYVQTLANNYDAIHLGVYNSLSSAVSINVEIVMQFKTPRDYSQTSNIIKSLKLEIAKEVYKMQNLEKDAKKDDLDVINKLVGNDEDEDDDVIEEVNKVKKKKKYKNINKEAGN